MTDDELKNAMDALYAYDSGSTDSGIRDEILRSKVIEEIKKDCTEHQLFSNRVSRIARELFLSEEAINEGYGLEAIRDFADWIDERLR